jgi:hypothetical protein
MKIQVFIFNYNHFEDAMNLFTIFNDLNYDTYLLNCKGSNDPEFEQTDRIKKYDNIYYSGQWNETLWHANADVILIINSDVKVPKPGLLMKRLEKYYNTYGEKAGIYAPNHSWTPWTYNPILLPTLYMGLKEVPMTDSTIWAITTEMAKKVDFVDTKINLFGWGIEIVGAYLCKLVQKYVTRDYALKCYHPRSTTYNRYEADMQWREWVARKGFGREFWNYYNSRDLYEFGWDGDYQPSIEVKFL